MPRSLRSVVDSLPKGNVVSTRLALPAFDPDSANSCLLSWPLLLARS